jgi:gliding motility-associated-like protein
VAYFLNNLGDELLFHHTQYNCWLTEVYDISDGGNCCINPQSPNWEISVGDGVTICSGESVDLNLLSNTGGQGPFQYQWTYEGASIGAQASVQHAPTVSGEACLTVTDVNGNSLTECTNVVVNESLDIQLTLSDTVGCLSSSFILSNNANPADVMLQQWVINGNVLSNQASFTFTPLNPGSYDVQLLQTAVNGCVSDTVILDAVVVYSPPNASFTADPLILEADQTNFSLINLSTGSLVSWQWSIGLNGEFGVSNDTNPQFSLPWGIGGIYPIQLVVLDSNGCSDQVQGEIVVNALFSLYVPNAFTPNNDGINDALELVSSAIVEGQFEMSIFNRWGQCVYFSKNPDDAWDGSFLGGDYYVEDGVYPYVIRLTADGDVESKEYRGQIQILR